MVVDMEEVAVVDAVVVAEAVVARFGPLTMPPTFRQQCRQPSTTLPPTFTINGGSGVVEDAVVVKEVVAVVEIGILTYFILSLPNRYRRRYQRPDRIVEEQPIYVEEQQPPINIIHTSYNKNNI